jgi:hypothetical protein
MSKTSIDGLRHAYEAYCRGDIQGAVDSIDLDPNILWIEPKEFYAGGTYQGLCWLLSASVLKSDCIV